MKQFDPVVASYLEYCRTIKKNHPDTIKDTRCTLGKFQHFMMSEGLEDFIWELDLSSFLKFVNVLRSKEERGSGISKQLSHLRGLLDYCWRVGHCNRNVLKGFEPKDSSQPYKARFLDESEIKRLIDACKKDSKQDRKERLIVLLLYGLGLRTGELCDLCYKDINFEKQEVFIKGKFEIERTIPVPGGVWIELISYLQENHIRRGHIFKTEVKRVPYRVVSLGQILRKYVSLAGLSNDVTPKTLRHTFACHLLDRGVDISVISTLMGHKSPAETNSYLHAFDKNKSEAISKFDKYFQEEAE